MQNNFRRLVNNGSETHFSAGLGGDVERSRMVASPMLLTTFNAGDIVPIYAQEILPSDVFSIDLDFVIRQSTLLKPTMGTMNVDYYAFFVPNRVVNTAFPSVMGENVYASWTADAVTLAPLVGEHGADSISVPVGSVADYYGYPTQKPIPLSILRENNDLLFRGYIEIYNEYFRDQNYQPPVPYSKLNVYEGFFAQHIPDGGTTFDFSGTRSAGTVVTSLTAPNNAVGAPAVKQAVYGNLPQDPDSTGFIVTPVARSSAFDALGAPLRANKLHDYFTSLLPSPMKGSAQNVLIGASMQGNNVLSPAGSAIFPVYPQSSKNYASWFSAYANTVDSYKDSHSSYFVGRISADKSNVGDSKLSVAGAPQTSPNVLGSYFSDVGGTGPDWNRALDVVNISDASAYFSIADLRMAASIQKVYETLGRVGSRYREYVRGFFGLEVDDPFKDIPEYLGHFRRELDLFQTAQTSSSEQGNTPQGNLAGFGYTNNGGHLFTRSLNEHGFVHIFAVVRHRNIYSSFMDRSKFRRSMLDFYQPQLANISEQPVHRKEIYPFVVDAPIGYQEAWAEYRYEPDRASGYMRPGISGTLAEWNYADDVPENFEIIDGEWLKSNSREVLDRTLAVTSSVAHQFLAQFVFRVDKERPMPTYSVPGLDIL
ncbi:major capsid protein [Dipodfec virus UOA04_Rod_765]|nr:major capsid protein [Dipodfec virus UOA04_Rod_765]